MRVLVTGAAGFVGSHLLRHLLDGGHEAFAGWLGEGARPAGLEGACWLPLDVTDPGSVAAALERARPHWVFHLAAQSSVGSSFADPLGTWTVNATGTLRLLAALEEGTRFLFVSSAEVYGPVPESEQPIPETRALRPANPYAASKAAAEMAVLQAAASGRVHAVVARSFNHTGPGQDTRFALPAFAAQLAAMRRGAAEPVLRVGNLEARRDFVDVRDVVHAYRVLVELGASGGVYNVCSGVPHSMGELVETMIELSGVPARVEPDPERFRPVDIPLTVGDPARIRALGWEPRVALRQSLADVLEEAGAAEPSAAGA